MATILQTYLQLQQLLINDADIANLEFTTDLIDNTKEVIQAYKPNKFTSNKYTTLAVMFSELENTKREIQKQMQELVVVNGDRLFHNFRLKTIDTVKYSDVKTLGELDCNVYGLIYQLQDESMKPLDMLQNVNS